jgi:hypothetical protein
LTYVPLAVLLRNVSASLVATPSVGEVPDAAETVT